ncbi:MAG: oligosaccharide flippase family protein [Verrucomicrobiales bacterium]|nr:oligosaccharide flippase family protein [Verrucomicrobiales bacterium]
MSENTFSKTIVRNTVSNYLRTTIALVAGLVTFRMLYGHFDKEEFGFWALLWSLYGIGVIFDFGFGFAAQKRVAELTVHRSWDALGRILSSILVFYAALAIVLPLLITASSHFWIGWIGIPPGREAEFRLALGLFFAGVSLSFPLGIFSEILRGQQRLHVVNWLVIFFVSLRVVLVGAAVMFDWSFTTLLLIALATTLGPDLCAGFFAFRSMKEVRISPRLFSMRELREISRFSLHAYFGSVITMVMSRTDQVVISGGLGVGAIVLYQAGAKIGEMFRDFTRQLQEALSPAAAALHAGGDAGQLRRLILDGTRWSALLSTPLYILCAVHLEGLITLLTGDASLADETWVTGQILLFWYYSSILTHSVSRRVFMMTGHEKLLTRLGVSEALANIVLSIVLVWWTRSVAGVALGSLLPTLWYGWRHYWRWMAKDTGHGAIGLFVETLLPAWLAALPALVVLFLMQGLAPYLGGGSALLYVLLSGSIAGLCACAGIWRYGMRPAERDQLRGTLGHRFPRLAKIS